MSKCLLPIFSKCFMIPDLIFKPLIHFEFIIVNGVRECPVWSYAAVQFIKEAIFSPLYILVNL